MTSFHIALQFFNEHFSVHVKKRKLNLKANLLSYCLVIENKHMLNVRTTFTQIKQTKTMRQQKNHFFSTKKRLL